MFKTFIKIIAVAFVATIPATLIKHNSINIEQKRDKELVDFMCQIVEPRAQIGSSREILEFLSSSVSKIELSQRPTLHMSEGSTPLTSPENRERITSGYSCIFAGRSDLKVYLIFPDKPFFDLTFFTLTLVVFISLLIAWVLLNRAVVSSQIILINTIENLVSTQVVDDNSIKIKSSILTRLFDLEVPVLKKIKQHIKHQKEIIDLQVTNLAEAEKFKFIVNATSALAHDLKNPVNTVEIALTSTTWEGYQKSKPSLQVAMRRLRSMIDSLKRADLESMVRPEWVVGPWEKIIKEMEPIAKTKDVVLHIENTINDKIHIDLSKIERAVMNLILNAIEAGAHNVWLSAGITGMDLAIRVSDDGPGVPEEFVHDLFGRGKTFNKKGGSGLGLHFVKETANGHGGDVTYTREDSRSTFLISLPKVVMPDKAIQIEQELSDNTHFNETMNQDISGIKTSAPVEQKPFKATVRLLDKALEKMVIEAIAKQYPTIPITDTLEDSSYVWTNDREILKQCITKKWPPVHMVSKDDTYQKIVDQVYSKLKYI